MLLSGAYLYVAFFCSLHFNSLDRSSRACLSRSLSGVPHCCRCRKLLTLQYRYVQHKASLGFWIILLDQMLVKIMHKCWDVHETQQFLNETHHLGFGGFGASLACHLITALWRQQCRDQMAAKLAQDSQNPKWCASFGNNDILWVSQYFWSVFSARKVQLKDLCFRNLVPDFLACPQLER